MFWLRQLIQAVHYVKAEQMYDSGSMYEYRCLYDIISVRICGTHSVRISAPRDFLCSAHAELLTFFKNRGLTFFKTG